MTSEQQRSQPRPSTSKESGLIQRARGFLREHFPAQAPHLVVGYSGGKDSLALLLVMRELERLCACRMTAVHVDHALRPESAEDAVRVVEIGRQLGVEVRTYRAERPVTEAFPGRGVEDAARSYRYGVLGRVVEEVGADAIAVGHHREDQAETVLLHLLRGAGLTGLRGMLPDHLLAVTWMQEPGFGPATRVRLVRPFLREAPEELQALVDRCGAEVIDDPSNAEPDFTRNRVRHELLPLMEEIAPGAAGRLVALADLAHEDDQALDNVSLLLLERSLEGEALRWDALHGAPQGLRRRVVRQWLLRFSEVDELSLERVDAVIALAGRGEGGKRVEIGDGWSVRFQGGRLEMISPRWPLA